MNEFSKKEVPELKKLLADKQESFRSFRFGGAGTRARNTREGRNIRKDIARLMTELRSRQLSVTK